MGPAPIAILSGVSTGQREAGGALVQSANATGTVSGRLEREAKLVSFAGSLRTVLAQSTNVAAVASAPASVPSAGTAEATPSNIAPSEPVAGVQSVAMPPIVAGAPDSVGPVPTGAVSVATGSAAALPSARGAVPMGVGKPRTIAVPDSATAAMTGPQQQDVPPPTVGMPPGPPFPPAGLPETARPPPSGSVTAGRNGTNAAATVSLDLASDPATPQTAALHGQAAGSRADETAPSTPQIQGPASGPSAPNAAAGAAPADIAALAVMAVPPAVFARAGPPTAVDPLPADPQTATPVRQIAPALLSLGGAGAGTQRLTVRLDPADLGQVEIRVDRPKFGPPEVRIAVERSETLALLQHDRHQLQQALDQAGIPSEGRQIEFRLVARIDPGGDGAPAGSWTAGNPNGEQGGGSMAGHGSGPGDRPGGRGQSGPADSSDDARSSNGAGTAYAPGWLRVGVNITA